MEDNLKEGKDTFLRKAIYTIIGAIGGLLPGAIIGMILVKNYYKFIENNNLSGEASIILIFGAIFGAPLGILCGAVIAYLKRNKKKWRIFFWILFLIFLIFFILRSLSPIVISPIGEIIKI
jgi:hypothetical protein